MLETDRQLLAALRRNGNTLALAAAARIEELQDTAKFITGDVVESRVFFHKKRGSAYWMMPVTGLLQSSAGPVPEGTELTSYMSHDDFKLWHRPKAEFFDGRFQEFGNG